MGDYTIQQIDQIDDPCPVIIGNDKGAMRTLKLNEKVIYAPMCELGFINFEKTGNYITIPDEYVLFSKADQIVNLSKKNDIEIEEVDGIKMVKNLQSN